MLKLFVCMTLVLCCCLIGYIKASSYRGRCVELQNVIEMIKLLDMEITYRKEPLVKSFKHITKTKNSWFSKMLGICSAQMICGYSLNDSWKTASRECRKNCPLKSSDIEILDDLVNALGKTDTEGHKKILEPSLMRLRTNLNEARVQEKKLGKMYISLGTAAGVIAVILLI